MSDCKNWKLYAMGIVFVIIGLVITWVALFFNIGSFVSSTSPALIATTGSSSSGSGSSVATAASGMTIFAVMYILAQFIERFIDPFSNSKILGSKDIPETNEDNKSQNAARAVVVWGLASACGIVLCYFTVGLMQIIGIVFIAPGLWGHWFDAFVSGVVVGAGTKPLHDLINVMQNK